MSTKTGDRRAEVRTPVHVLVALPVALSLETDVQRPLPVAMYSSYTVAHSVPVSV